MLHYSKYDVCFSSRVSGIFLSEHTEFVCIEDDIQRLQVALRVSHLPKTKRMRIVFCIYKIKDVTERTSLEYF
jgi:hypothetical protein